MKKLSTGEKQINIQKVRKAIKQLRLYMMMVNIVLMLPIAFGYGVFVVHYFNEDERLKAILDTIKSLRLDKYFYISFLLSMIPVTLLFTKIAELGYSYQFNRVLILPNDEIASKVKSYRFYTGFMLVLAGEQVSRLFS